MDKLEKLNACHLIETLAEEVYRTMALIFPEGKDFLGRLAEEEKRHAEVITMCLGYYKTSPDPEQLAPPAETEIAGAIEKEMQLKELLASRGVGLKEALEMAYGMELNMAENYFNIIREFETDPDIKAYISECYDGDKSHAEQIKEYFGSIT